jgi:hypothetical protein
MDGGRLLARHRRHGDIPLTPDHLDAFTAGQWFLSEARFERDSAGAVTLMRVSAGRARNLRFERMR